MITEQQARIQFDRADKLGWADICRRAGADIDVDPALLLGIGSRETNLDHRYLAEPGDNGNGFGITQVDKRADPAFAASGAWRNAEACFRYTAAKLAAETKQVTLAQGKTISGKFRSGQKYTYKMPTLDAEAIRRVALAGYNCGWRAAGYHVALRRDPDRGTTGGDYSRDVLQRAAWFAEWLAAPTGQAERPAA